MSKKSYQIGLLQAASVVFYCILVSWSFSVLKKIFANPPEFWIAAFMLVYLVFSAAVTGVLIFGYPAYLLLNKELKRASQIFLYTLLFCAIFGSLILFLVAFV